MRINIIQRIICFLGTFVYGLFFFSLFFDYSDAVTHSFSRGPETIDFAVPAFFLLVGVFVITACLLFAFKSNPKTDKDKK